MRSFRIQKAIIGLLVLLLMTALPGCSAVRLAYSNGPQLSWWWLDDYVDFSAQQEPIVKRDLDALFAWHRQTQLPGWIALLTQAEADVMVAATPAQVCRWQVTLRDALDPSLQRALADAADLVPGLGEPQFEHLSKRFAKSMVEMHDDYLQPDLEDRRSAAMDRTLERIERLYGRLGAAQRQVIADGLRDSPFDPQAWAAERLRRQRDTLQTLRQLVSSHADHDERLAALRALVERSEHSPDPAYRSYQLRLDDYNCGFAARIHNATTLAQRQEARDRLKGWESDFRELVADRS